MIIRWEIFGQRCCCSYGFFSLCPGSLVRRTEKKASARKNREKEREDRKMLADGIVHRPDDCLTHRTTSSSNQRYASALFPLLLISSGGAQASRYSTIKRHVCFELSLDRITADEIPSLSPSVHHLVTFFVSNRCSSRAIIRRKQDRRVDITDKRQLCCYKNSIPNYLRTDIETCKKQSRKEHLSRRWRGKSY